MGLFDDQSLVMHLILKVFCSLELFQILCSNFSGYRFSHHCLIILFKAFSVPGFLHIFVDNLLFFLLRPQHFLFYLLDCIFSVRWMLFSRWLFFLLAHVKSVQEELVHLSFTIFSGHSLPGLFEISLLIRWLCTPLILGKYHIGFVRKSNHWKHLLVLKFLVDFMFLKPFFFIDDLRELDSCSSDFLLFHQFFFMEIGLMLVQMWHFKFSVFHFLPM